MNPTCCPSRDELSAFAVGNLAGQALERVAAHLADCVTCQACLEELDGHTNSVVAVLRQHPSTFGFSGPGPPHKPDAPAREPGVVLAGASGLCALAGASGLCGLPPARAEDAQPQPLPTRIGPYEIRAELGRGGMGVVYKAWHEPLHRLVALKMMLAGRYSDARYRARFRTEAEAIARLHHPNLIQIYDVGEHDGQPYFVLEFIDGGNLDDRVAGRPVPSAQAAGWLTTLAQAVDYAHRQGIVHRDLKPPNILLTADGALKVTDFGLARLLDDEKGNTSSHTIIGTPEYMAPEQVRAEPVGPAADVYALGALLYTLLVGRPPLQAASPLETLRLVTTCEPVSPRQLQPEVPRDLETICLKCLSKEPERRYATALALAEDLERFQAGLPVRARPVGPVGRGWRWCRRNPVVAGLLAGVALSLLLGSGVATWLAVVAGRNADDAIQQAGRADQETKKAVRAQNEAETERDKAREAERERSAQLVRAEWLAYAGQITLAQREWLHGDAALAWHYLEASRAPLRGWEYDYLHTLFNQNQRTLRGHSGGVVSVTFSPNEGRAGAGGDLGRRWLASAGGADLAPGEIKLWDAVTGRLCRTFQGHTRRVTSVSFGPGGKLASAGNDGTVRVWDAETGRQIHSFPGSLRLLPGVCFRPDGKQLAGIGADGKPKVWDLDRGKEILSLPENTGLVAPVVFSPDGQRLATAGSDRTVTVWEANTGRRLFCLQGGRAGAGGHTDAVHSLAFSPDGKQLASGGSDNTIKIWDLATGQETLTLRGHTSAVRGLSFRPGVGNARGQLASGSYDKTVRIWDTTTGQELLAFKGHTLGVGSVAFSPDGKQLASAGEDRTVKLWEVGRAQETLVFPWRTDVVTGRQVLVLLGPGPVPGGAFRSDGKRLASGGRDGTVKVWDTDTGKQILSHQDGQMGAITGIAFRPDGTRLAACSSEGVVKVWEADKEQEVFSIRGPIPLSGLAFSPDGRHLAVGSNDATIKLLDAGTGREIRALRGHTSAVSGVAFSRDGRRLASASWDRTVKVWNPVTGQVILTLTGHTREVKGVAFSPDGKRLASASFDQTVKIWEAALGQEVLSLTGHTGAVQGVAFSADGKRLASAAALSGTIEVWEAGGAPDP